MTNPAKPMRHIPVLLQEVLKGLEIHRNEVELVFVDCNLGDGGHTEAVIETTDGNVEVYAFDLDQNAIDRAKANIEAMPIVKSGATFNPSKQLHLIRKNFRTLEESLPGVSADAILFDLGISSFELDESGRGFSFQKDEPLAMTFGTNEDHSFTAYDIVNTWDEENIADIIYAYGEDKYSRRVAKAIVEKRKALAKELFDAEGGKIHYRDIEKDPRASIRTTKELADIVKASYPAFARRGKIHPATRTFQALRIAVNDELRALQDALPQAVKILKPGGRLAVISFHSLEDRIVKRFFKEITDNGLAEPVTKKPIAPGSEEVGANPRSRSAKLRIIKKI